MLVYRIEGVNGGGIYRGEYSRQNPMSWVESKHPAPWRDSLLVHNSNRKRGDAFDITDSFDTWFSEENYIFGFASTEQLRSWVFVDLWLWLMQERGFRLAVMEIEDDDVIVGHTQCIFKRENVKQTSYFPIAEFFGIYEEPAETFDTSFD